MSLNREYTRKDVTIASGAALSEAIDMRLYSGGMLIAPAGWTAADIGFHVCDTEDGTYVPLKDHDNAYVVCDAVAVDTAFEMPPEIFAAGFIKLWSTDGAGASANQGADRAIAVMLKG